MSLAEQSQQWYPTTAKVTVLQARGLRIKGKNGTNDAYAVMHVAKDKFCTAVAEKSVSPEWKEEATFDLPLFHEGNAERCTLYVQVMHRGPMGMDKMLGQAIINLVQLQANKSRNKTEWFKLVNKSGKQDKERGEVQLDVQFLRNNMTASMYDLSAKDKPRSRIGKLKDKLRGKKRDGPSDSLSAIVPSVSQPLTDSGEDEEGEAHTGTQKMPKSLLSPKTNLQRNISLSMSMLDSGPDWDAPSGVQKEPPEGKKFGFLTHKHSGSSDSKDSHGPLSLLGHHKQSAADQITICINGSHVYSEEPQPKPNRTGSSLSLTGSPHGSTEDLHKSGKGDGTSTSSEPFRVFEKIKHDKMEQERKSQEEEQERKRLEERERKRQEEHENERKRLEEQERKRKDEQVKERKRLEEWEKERKKQEENERKRAEEREKERKKQEENERKRTEEQERKRAEEWEKERKKQEENERERKRAEEQEKERKKQEENERKRRQEEQERKKQNKIGKEVNTKAEQRQGKEIQLPKREEVTASNPFEEKHTTDPFEETNSSNPSEGSFLEDQPEDPQTTSGILHNRLTRVSAVKPRRHPVKPLRTTDTSFASSAPVGQDVKPVGILATMSAKPKETEAREEGPYSQLTQTELIALVIKQQSQLAEQNKKVRDLEDYIDNLLVRVLEENPGLLMNMNSAKKAC